MHEFFFNLGEVTKALAANSWYVVKGTGASQIKYYQDSGATSYSNKWSSANSSTNTADDLNTFLNGEIVQSGDTVYIKAGEYKLSGQINLGDKEVEEERFVNINPSSARPLHLYGGFAGTETNSSDRNFSINITTLNANANSENPRRVFCITSDSTVDGFTITGGHSPTTSDGFYSYGGGISIRGSYDDNTSEHITPKPAINNCTIIGNTATECTYGGHGGGIFIGNASPTITNCTITGNTAKAKGGGGIYINGDHDDYDYEPITPTPTITNCTITGNTADSDGDGGGIFIDQANPTISNCTITDNTVDGEGGGIYSFNYNSEVSFSPIITNCTIAGNTAYVGDGIGIDGTNPIITNCTIVGDGISSQGSSTLRNTLVWNNEETFSFNYEGNTVTYNYKWENPVSSDVTVNGVTHKVFFAKDNHILYSLYGRGVSDSSTPTADQLGNPRSNPMSIGAVEISLPTILSFDITQTETISAKYGKTIISGETLPSYDVAATKETITTIASLDNAALNSKFYSISWDAVPSTTGFDLSFDNSGDLIVKSTKPAGTTYETTVKGQAVFDLITTPKIISKNTAEKKFSITVDSGDMILTLSSKDLSNLPDGKVGTVYSEDQYFTATVEPSSADIYWNIERLPEGLSFDNGKISGTPMEAGKFTVKIIATAKLPNYYEASRDIQISMFVESADINLTLISKDLPGGKVGTVYSENQYFTATVDPLSADLTWEASGLPAGLSFDNGIISGTPTESGDFSVNVTVTATLANYYTVSKSAESQLVIEAESENTGGDNSGGGGDTDNDNEPVVTESDFENMTPEQRREVKSLTFTDLSNLQYIFENYAEDLVNLTTVNISADTDIGNGGELELSFLPETLKEFSISGNASLKSLNLKECKVPNINASGCTELTSVNVSGNENIVTLDVSSTGVKELNVSNCPKLTNVDCSGGVISKLDVSGCYALKEIKCEGNSLLALDIPSDLTNLESIDCSDQSLQDIKLPESFNFDVFVESPDMISENAVSASSVILAADTKLANVKNLQAFDANGKKIENTSDDSGNIIFASAPYSMTYDYNTGFKDKSTGEDTLMDVSINKAADSTESVVGGSGGGCDLIRNSEFGIRNLWILFLASVLIFVRRKVF